MVRCPALGLMYLISFWSFDLSTFSFGFDLGLRVLVGVEVGVDALVRVVGWVGVRVLELVLGVEELEGVEDRVDVGVVDRGREGRLTISGCRALAVISAIDGLRPKIP